MADPEKLDDLARKGREEIASRTAGDDRRAARREKFKQARHQLIAECSTTSLGWLGTGDLSMLAPLLIVSVACFLAGRNYPFVVKGAVGFYSMLFVLLVAARIQGRSGWAREVKWIAALPFPVEGYLPNLGDVERRAGGIHSSGKSTKLEVTVQFRNDIPKSAEEIIAGFDPKLMVSRKTGTSLQVSNGDFPAGETNYPLHRFVRRFVDQVLIPLNGQAPVARMDVSLKT